MNKSNYLFISTISAYMRNLSNFTNEVCDFIGCQFALESSFGESSLAHCNHNLCGMKNPLVRISSSIHAGDCTYFWAQFVDGYSCCIDYLLCLQYHKPISSNYDTIEHFGKFIASFYCPEHDYVSRIERIYNQFINFNS